MCKGLKAIDNKLHVVLLIALAVNITASNVKDFRLPSIPPALAQTGLASMGYLSIHYWDYFDFEDSGWLNHRKEFDRIITDYAVVLDRVPEQEAIASIRKTMQEANGNPAIFALFLEWMDKIYYNPNSPLRNETYYTVVLQSVLASPLVNGATKIKCRKQLTMIKKNRKGTIANDFSLTLSNGTACKLSMIESPFIILYFNNPDCHDCQRVKSTLSSLNDPRVKIVAVYPDQDISVWKKTVYPPTWINGNNKTIMQQQLYDLKAIPTLYLLDQDRRVLLKDASAEQIIDYLSFRN